MFREIQWRTFGKVLSWRVLLTIMNFVYTFAVTGNYKAGLAVAGISAIINTFLYWGHERIWNQINWGKVKTDETLNIHSQV